MQNKSLLLFALLLPTVVLSQEIFKGPHKFQLTAADYGLAGMADMKDLNQLAIQYFNNFC